MPITYRLRLQITDPSLVRFRHLRALVATWCERGVSDDEHHANTKSWTVSPLYPHGHDYALEVSLLTEDAERRLQASLALAASSTLRLGRAHARLLGPPNGEGGCSRPRAYGDLWADASTDPIVTLQFLTPVVFLTGKDQHPFPTAGLVFGHYRARWRAFGTEPLSADLDFASMGLRTLQYEGRSEAVRHGVRKGRTWSDRDYVGFLGSMSFEAPRATPRQRRWLHALATFADFCGTGANTTSGMGVTRYQPPEPLAATGELRPAVAAE